MNILSILSRFSWSSSIHCLKEINSERDETFLMRCFIVSGKKLMPWSCYLWLWFVLTPAISRIALSGFSSHLPGRLTYKYSKVFFLLWRSTLRYYRWTEIPGCQWLFMRGFRFRSSPFSCLRPGRSRSISAVRTLSPHATIKTSGTQGRSTWRGEGTPGFKWHEWSNGGKNQNPKKSLVPQTTPPPQKKKKKTTTTTTTTAKIPWTNI